ncbi:MAG: Flp pilus assembly protein CpaB [Chloroflexota bacterium]|nr:Flp pilus assembly protein CpaB [Chloroflexota bacterium]
MARTLTHMSPERTNRLILIGAVTLAALAALLIFVALSRSGSGTSGGAAPAGDITVVTAAGDIAAGQKITDAMLTTTSVARAHAIAGALTSPAAAVGLTAIYPLAKGEQIAASKLVGGASSKVSPSYIIPAGKRAFAISVEQKTTPTQLIVAGDHVDVIAVGKKKAAPGATGQDLTAGITLLQDVEVLAVDDVALKPVSRLDANGKPITSGTADGTIATNPDATNTQPNAKTVTLAVTPAQAQLLAVGQDGYHLYLSLRPPGDTSAPADPSNIMTLPAPIQ